MEEGNNKNNIKKNKKNFKKIRDGARKVQRWLEKGGKGRGRKEERNIQSFIIEDQRVISRFFSERG
jgi:hypothetical protein